jgi:hypothetical protein
MQNADGAGKDVRFELADPGSVPLLEIPPAEALDTLDMELGTVLREPAEAAALERDRSFTHSI